MASQFSTLLQKLDSLFVGKCCATVGIDIQAPRIAPRDKGARIEFSLNYCLPRRFNFGGYFGKRFKVFPIGVGQQECVRKDGAGSEEVFFVFVPNDTNRFGKLFHKHYLQKVI